MALSRSSVLRSGNLNGFPMLGSWVAWLEARGLSKATVGLYAYGLFRLFRFHGFPDPADICEEQVSEFLKSLSNRATCRVAYYRGIRSAFGYWNRRGWIACDPTVELTLR